MPTDLAPAYNATFIGTSRPATRRRGTKVPALSCGTVVHVVEDRGGRSVIAVAGDPTFGFRYVILRSQLAR